MVDISKRATSIALCLLNSICMRPQPFPDFELIFRMPSMRFSIASNRDVASISTVRGELPYIEKCILMFGNVWDGANLTANSGIRANPINDKQANTKIIENDDIFRAASICLSV